MSELWIENYFRPFETTRHDITLSDIENFRDVLSEAKSERPLQKYLERHPQLLCSHLRSGHGEWVIPQKRLGAEYVPDFVIGCGNSAGKFWQFMELESPCAQLMTARGSAAVKLRTAIEQIDSWRGWLEQNLEYARRPPVKKGLGLEDVSPRSAAVVVIGRRSQESEQYNSLRQRYYHQHSIEIISYDRLFDDFLKIAKSIGSI
jgi:hypothetical protein